MHKVSVITPTANRPEMLKRCIEMFLAQDWEDKEMIVAEGYMSLTHVALPLLVEDVMNLKFALCKPNDTIGHKRNIAIAESTGDIILHMDDDDTYAPDWVSQSVKFLTESGAQMVGLKNAWFTDNKRLWKYKYTGSQPYVLGATMCFYKSLWERKSFADTSSGEDTQFCIDHMPFIKAHNYIDGFVGTIHQGNTVKKSTHDPKIYEPHDFAKLKDILDNNKSVPLQ